jgi:hypothetical protein
MCITKSPAIGQLPLKRVHQDIKQMFANPESLLYEITMVANECLSSDEEVTTSSSGSHEVPVKKDNLRTIYYQKMLLNDFAAYIAPTIKYFHSS